MGGIAHEDAAPRRSAAVKARRSRLAEHGAKRRAHGLDGETGVGQSERQGKTALSRPGTYLCRGGDTSKST